MGDPADLQASTPSGSLSVGDVVADLGHHTSRQAGLL